MLTAEQTNLVEQCADRIYKRHITVLLAAIEWVKKLDPLNPNAIGKLYDGFLRDTHEAIQKYGEELVSEIVRVTTRISPILSRSEAEQLVSCCAKFVDSELYGKRMLLFREALYRNARTYGVSIDDNAIRFDLYEGRYFDGTTNQVREIASRLKREFDILVISGEATAAKATSNEASSVCGPVATKLLWENLTDVDFERLIFALISSEQGYENPEWLMKTNAPDRGRDLSVYRVHTDALGGTIRQRVIIQCKHWLTKSVGSSEIAMLREQMKLWEPPRVDVHVIATSGRFTSDAVTIIERQNHSDSALRIEMWTESHLERLLASRPAIIAEFSLR